MYTGVTEMANNGEHKTLARHEFWLAIGIMLLAFGLILLFAGRWEIKQAGFLGTQAPEIQFESQNGVSSSLSKHDGVVVLINFWASWCASCIEEMPTLRMLEEHFRGKGFVLLAFNIGGDDEESIENKISNINLPQNIIFKFSKEQLKAYPIDGLPVSILITKTGKISKVYRGPRNWMNLETLREIENLISQ
ncbi:MAG: TlpA family protein disulfide reductase [Deltaproteobacteria bacterium]|nr:TlpA family protein disulfide reductase [Deltaproteobacteria bacterium]